MSKAVRLPRCGSPCHHCSARRQPAGLRRQIADLQFPGATGEQRLRWGRANATPGTVKPPPVVVPPITKPGTYSVGGVCTVVVEQVASTVTLHVDLLPFATVRNRLTETRRYLAGVCEVRFVMPGKGVTDITPQDATVKVCFAAIPNTTNKLYVYDDHNWFPLDTTVQNGLACAPATKTGKYVLVQMP